MLRRLLLFALILFASPAGAASPLPLPGFYGGGYGEGDQFIYTQVELEQLGQSLKGHIYQPYERVDSPAIANLRVRGGRVRFTSAGLSFDLQRTATGFKGFVTSRGKRYPAYFAIRPGSPPAASLIPLEGTYDLGGGRILTLSRNNGTGSLWYLELPSGRTGFLFNLSNTDFIAGPCLYCAGPEYLRLHFDPPGGGGRVDSVRLTIGGRDIIAKRLAGYGEEAVSFVSGDGTKLAGSLFLPASSGPHPAVVLVHGSGGQTRNGYYGHIRFLAEAYARRGIAVLAYDKRGTGDSSGDYDKAGLAVLADDAAAGLKYLAARPDIRADRLGVSGSSQAGWLVPMAATRFPSVHILQFRAGSAPAGVEESERWRLVRQMRADGFAADEIRQAMRIREMMDNYAKTGANWGALEAAAAPVKDRYWMKQYIGGLPPRDSSDWPWLREAFSYDVRSDFAQARGALQILYGGTDALIDPEVIIPLVRQAMPKDRTAEVEIEVIPNATHNGLEGKTGGEREFPRLKRFVPGYFDKIVDWAAERLR